MEIVIYRKLTNRLYTEGTMIVNGLPFSHTLESSVSMLPAGIYSVTLRSQSKGARVIAITAKTHITAGNGYSNSYPQGHIIIGEPLIPGCVVKSRAAYNRLFERIRKCKTPITLTISDSHCKANFPISHWLKPQTINHKP